MSGVRSLADFGVAPGKVADDLARALAASVCRTFKHEVHVGASCADCAVAGRALAVSVGRALFTCRTYKRRGPIDATDYEAVGRALEQLERPAP